VPSLENSLSLLEKDEKDTRKRSIFDETEDVSMDSHEDNSQRVKKPRPFQFSQM
jgi:hypothetical protein